MSSTATFNANIITKLSWMSRKLKNIDDLKTLAIWVNTMHSIKMLMFPLHSTTNSESAIKKPECAIPTSNSSTSWAPWSLLKHPPDLLYQTVLEMEKNRA